AKALSSTVGAVSPHSPAAEAGLQAGDHISAIDGHKIRMFAELHAAVDRHIAERRTEPMTLVVQRPSYRQNQSFTVGLTPRQIDNKDAFGMAIRTLGMGVSPPEPSPENSVYIPLSPWRAPVAATSQCWWIADMSLVYVWRMVSHQADTKQLSGPVGMAKMARSAASYGIYDLFYLIAFISVSIGLINLFPIPLLDGGHLLYYACELVLGRPLKEQVQEFGFRVGLLLVLGLMVFATLNDLIR
ncbi:MAG: RIP metalloprotease RseP, partial [Rhizomicrobium sp.]